MPSDPYKTQECCDNTIKNLCENSDNEIKKETNDIQVDSASELQGNTI